MKIRDLAHIFQHCVEIVVLACYLSTLLKLINRHITITAFKLHIFYYFYIFFCCFTFVSPCFVLQSSVFLTNNNSLTKQPVKSRKSGNTAAQNGPVSLDFLRSIPKSKPTNEVSSGTYKYQMRRRLVILTCSTYNRH